MSSSDRAVGQSSGQREYDDPVTCPVAKPRPRLSPPAILPIPRPCWMGRGKPRTRYGMGPTGELRKQPSCTVHRDRSDSEELKWMLQAKERASGSPQRSVHGRI